MQVQNLETETVHTASIESIGRCVCCGDHMFKVLVDGKEVLDIRYLDDHTTAFVTEEHTFRFTKTLNELRVASGYLSLQEFLAL